MHSQIEVYRTYLPNLKHLYIMFGILVALTLVISIPATAFGQSDSGDDDAVTDQTVKIVGDVSPTPKEDPSVEAPEEPTPAATPAPAAENPAPATTPVVPQITEEDVDEPLPTTGPAETISATIGIVSLALVYSYYKNSRTLVTQAIRNS